MAQSHLSPPNCLERKKKHRRHFFEIFSRDYFISPRWSHVQIQLWLPKTPSFDRSPMGSATLVERKTLKCCSSSYRPRVTCTMAQSHLSPPNCLERKEYSAPCSKMLCWIICPSPRWRHRQQHHWPQKKNSFRHIAYGLCNTCATMNVKLLLFVIQDGEPKPVYYFKSDCICLVVCRGHNMPDTPLETTASDIMG